MGAAGAGDTMQAAIPVLKEVGAAFAGKAEEAAWLAGLPSEVAAEMEAVPLAVPEAA